MNLQNLELLVKAGNSLAFSYVDIQLIKVHFPSCIARIASDICASYLPCAGQGLYQQRRALASLLMILPARNM